MRAVIQRTKHASVTVDGQKIASIEQGLLVLLGVENNDSQDDIDWLTSKIIGMRIFSDDDGKMNLSVKDIDGDIIVVSQFTLYASTKKGNRPSFLRSAKPDVSIPLYEKFVSDIQDKLGKTVGTGEFGADMKVELLNDGPVTIIMDSQDKQ